jgi:hypothetical protein
VLLEWQSIAWHNLNMPWRDRVKCGWYIFLFIDNLIVDAITFSIEVKIGIFPLKSLPSSTSRYRYLDISESCSSAVS